MSVKKTSLVLLFVGVLSTVTPPYPQSAAGYDANIGGKIVALFTYPNGAVYIRLDTQPSTHPVCNPSYFAMSPAASGHTETGVDRMYARALTAFVAGQQINVGYDSQGNCVHSYIRVERVG